MTWPRLGRRMTPLCGSESGLVSRTAFKADGGMREHAAVGSIPTRFRQTPSGQGSSGGPGEKRFDRPTSECTAL